MVDLTDIRAATADLPRSYEVLVRDRIKFRVGRIVFLAVAPDEQTIGIGFPREERAATLATDPEKFPAAAAVGRAVPVDQGAAGRDRVRRTPRTGPGRLGDVRPEEGPDRVLRHSR